MKNFFTFVIEQTILKDRPYLAESYSSALTILITLTTLYVLLVFVSAVKKAIGIIILIGWVLFTLSIVFKLIGL
ncbi:MAG: hypothetical protein QXI29_01915 [Candidatus Methanomethylicaceae archaeon]